MKNQVTPEQMTVICNIQMMWDKTGYYHDNTNFNALCKMSYTELLYKQNDVLEDYNHFLK